MARKDDKQMEMLFEEGGIADDGMSVDPVSGNEVPAGSMASEVRDDVPAQLSEGEYVVPADVTRYYGVKFFEDLRRQAKMGLGEMEQDGRIGGEPVAVDEGSLTPEEEAVLGMAMGGMVEKQGYNEGGTVAANVAPNYTMANYLFGTGGTGSFGTGTAVTPNTIEDRAVTLYGPDGSTVSLVLPAQQTEYDNYIQQGYSETQDVVAQQTAAAFGGGDGNGGGDAFGGTGGTGSPSSEVDIDRTPTYGLGLGATGTAIAGGIAGLGLAGLGGMAKGAALGKRTAEFNNARNDLVDAIQTNNAEALAKAEAAVRSTYDALKPADRISVLGEGKTSTDAVNNVKTAVTEAMQSVAPTGMTYNPATQSYQRDEGTSNEDLFGGTRIGTGEQGTPVYAPGPTTTVPTQRPDRGGGTTSTPSAAPSAPDREGNVVTRSIDNVFGTSFADTDGDGESGEEGGNDGKIVCTAMNNSYGFGSYRQAVWLRYSEKNLTEYHEKGYHRIFLPLVHKAYNSGDKNSPTLRKVLENIARHRTADLRAEMQGKRRDTVGRIYRSLLEPLCYIVGRLSKK